MKTKAVHRELLLASTSPARASLMNALRVRYRAVAPGVDEAVAPGTPVQLAVAQLARRKAEAVSARWPEALVLAADQLASIDGELLGKPTSPDEARGQLQRLSGRTHSLATGVCLLGPGVSQERVDLVRLTAFALSPEEQQAYLTLGEWQGCAGGYRIEGAGQALFSDIEGDRTSIQGLPMLVVVRLLREAGVRFFESS
jgi:septum formation protein